MSTLGTDINTPVSPEGLIDLDPAFDLVTGRLLRRPRGSDDEGDGDNEDSIPRQVVYGRQKKVSFVLLFAQTDIVFLPGLLRGQPHCISTRNDVAKFVSVFTDVPQPSRFECTGGAYCRADLKRVCVWDARFHLGVEAPGLEEVVLLHHL